MQNSQETLTTQNLQQSQTEVPALSVQAGKQLPEVSRILIQSEARIDEDPYLSQLTASLAHPSL
ncbi:hypothetical protein [Ponticaulis sp.]|uniref:hypothetical protein n=1 Tax=Ponticaulis sp. TaxID=2020902 RepID=UPI000B6D4ED4|nr:hypothetical protein [Ponticaulis sp.]MAI90074.1 hypothetical protein [Ponticaulis sp.]OUX99730.1 MAG: hypothetical protein CBB65_06510 [Hyphomonadaceae bacterium TMED5]